MGKRDTNPCERKADGVRQSKFSREHGHDCRYHEQFFDIFRFADP